MLQRIRLRVLALLVGTTLAVIGLVSFAAWPVWPVVGVAVATVAIAVNTMAHRLSQPVCYSCGKELTKRDPGEHGVVCEQCGSLNPLPPSFEKNKLA